ncbi:hypothetical protein ACLOJK_018549, partial [Asimina triloba]
MEIKFEFGEDGPDPPAASTVLGSVMEIGQMGFNFGSGRSRSPSMEHMVLVVRCSTMEKMKAFYGCFAWLLDLRSD